MKKTLVFLLTFMMVFVALSVSAVEIANVETADEYVQQAELFAAPAQTFSAEYGELIYFSDFESVTAQYSPIGLVANSDFTTFNGETVVKCGMANYAGSPIASVTVANNANAKLGTAFTWTDGKVLEAKLTIMFDWYQTGDASYGKSVGINGKWDGNYASWNTFAGAKNEWHRSVVGPVGKTWISTADAPIKSIGISQANDGSDACFYIDNLYVYAMRTNVAYFVENTEDTTAYVIDATGDKVTLPKVLDATGATGNAWTDGTKIFRENTEVNAADIKGKIFTPTTMKDLPEIPAAWDNTYGELLFYTDFRDADNPYSAVYSPLGFKLINWGTVVAIDGESALKAGSPVGGYLGFGVIQGGNSADYTFKDKNGNVMSGKFTLIADYYIDEDTAPDSSGNYGYGRYNEGGTPGDWWGATSNSNLKKWSTSKSLQITSDELWKVELYYRNDSGVNLYFDNIRLYCKPDNQMYFKASQSATETKQYSISGDTFSVPDDENLGFEPIENFVAWTDGTKTYAVGETVTKASLVGKTLYPITQTAPASEESPEAATHQSTSAIRFKAAFTSAQREFYENLGFLVAAKSILDENDFYELTHDANNGSNNLYVERFAIDATNDIVYDTIGDSTIHSLVIYNISPDAYDKVFVVRPFAQVKTSAGKLITVYGEEMETTFNALS